MSEYKKQVSGKYEIINIHPDMPETERENLKEEIAEDIVRLLLKAQTEDRLYAKPAAYVFK